MQTFIIAMIVALVLDVLGRIHSLGSGKIKPKTPLSEAWNLLVNGSLLVWGAVVLSKWSAH